VILDLTFAFRTCGATEANAKSTNPVLANSVGVQGSDRAYNINTQNPVFRKLITRAKTFASLISQTTALRLALLLALIFSFAQVPNARADSASCLAKATSFVTELDELLEKEQEWDTSDAGFIRSIIFAGVRERAGRGLLERDRVRARNDLRHARSCRVFIFRIRPETSIHEGFMSAVIIQFVPRPKQRKRFLDFPVPTQSAFRADDLAMGNADTPARCENVLSIDEYRDNSDTTS
jgi:hypothetical protein